MGLYRLGKWKWGGRMRAKGRALKGIRIPLWGLLGLGSLDSTPPLPHYGLTPSHPLEDAVGRSHQTERSASRRRLHPVTPARDPVRVTPILVKHPAPGRVSVASHAPLAEGYLRTICSESEQDWSAGVKTEAEQVNLERSNRI